MQTIDYVRTHGWGSLTSELGIDIRAYDNGFRVLNYSQINSPKLHPIVKECRGLILDAQLNIICRPFDRFFNYLEGDTADFCFHNATLFEKADGSLVKIYYNPLATKWEIATRGTAFAEADHVWGLGHHLSKQPANWTFRSAILDAMGLSEDTFQTIMSLSPVGRHYTILAEYCSPNNRIVTRYDAPHLVFLGLRHNQTGEEIHPESYSPMFESLMRMINSRLPYRYEASTPDDVKRLVESLPNLQEGIVAVEQSGRRCKVKSSQYVAVHQLRGNGVPTLNNLMELVLKNEQDEVLVHFPEMQEYIDPVRERLSEMLQLAEAVYHENADIEDQKKFAIKVKDTQVSSLCFSARRANGSCTSAFDQLDLNRQKSLLEKFIKGE